MLEFFKNRLASEGTPTGRFTLLGRLETAVMEILWSGGERRVQDVVTGLDRGLAYTTVMTTLDRLYKKGLLDRTKQDRAYVYTAKLSREAWERRRATALVAGFLAGPEASPELLVSCFLQAVSEQDEQLLEKLAKEIRKRRRELARRGSP